MTETNSPELRRRRKLLEKCLKSWQAWGCLVHSEGLFSIKVDGEEYHYYDILEGLASLPPRQRQAVFYMCIQDMSELETATVMGFDNPKISPIQQYKASGLVRLIKYMDADNEEQKELIKNVAKYGKHPRKKRIKKVAE